MPRTNKKNIIFIQKRKRKRKQSGGNADILEQLKELKELKTSVNSIYIVSPTNEKNSQNVNKVFKKFTKLLTNFTALDKKTYDVYSMPLSAYNRFKQKSKLLFNDRVIEGSYKNTWLDDEIAFASASASASAFLPKSIQIFINTQTKSFTKILQELEQNNKKNENENEDYASLVWPTISEYYTYPKDAKDINKKQLNDLHTRYPNMLSSMNDTVIEKYLQIANENQFRESMKRSNVNEWTEIFNKFTKLLNDYGIDVIPIIDHGRISNSLDLYLETFNKFLQQDYKSFHTSIIDFQTAFIQAKDEWGKTKCLWDNVSKMNKAKNVDSDSLTLQQAIDNHFSIETTTDEKISCPNEKVGTSRTKFFSPGSESRGKISDLLISLKRNLVGTKVLNDVNVTSEITYNKEKFHLSAVACHDGSHKGGHFYVYVKRMNKNKNKNKNNKNYAWFRISDQEISAPIDINDKKIKKKINGECVMFLYRKNQDPVNLPKAKGLKNIGQTCYLNSLMQIFNTTHLITNNNINYPNFIKFVNEVFKDSSYYNNFIEEAFGVLGRQQGIGEALMLLVNSTATKEIAEEIERNDKNNFFLKYPLYSCVKKKCPTGVKYQTMVHNDLLNISININDKNLKTQPLVMMTNKNIKIKVIPTKYDPKDTNTDFASKSNPPPQSKAEKSDNIKLITYDDYQNLKKNGKLEYVTTHLFMEEDFEGKPDPTSIGNYIWKHKFPDKKKENFDEYFKEIKKWTFSNIIEGSNSSKTGWTVLWLGYSIKNASSGDKVKFKKEDKDILAPIYSEKANNFWEIFVEFMGEKNEKNKMKDYVFKKFQDEQKKIPPSSPDSGGKRRTRKSKITRKSEITRKSVRKHRGIIQTGGNTGRLRKGYKYTGRRLKNGKAEIVRVKRN